MTDKEIMDKIGAGNILAIPKSKGKLVPYFFNWLDNRDIQLLEWEYIELFVLRYSNKHMPDFTRICKAEKDDLIEPISKRIVKQGWKSLGWDGETYDFYRMVM